MDRVYPDAEPRDRYGAVTVRFPTDSGFFVDTMGPCGVEIAPSN
jgi:hypothetical protein